MPIVITHYSQNGGHNRQVVSFDKCSKNMKPQGIQKWSHKSYGDGPMCSFHSIVILCKFVFMEQHVALVLTSMYIVQYNIIIPCIMQPATESSSMSSLADKGL